MNPGHDNQARGAGACRGQAMIESCIVIVFLCLLFLGLFQLIHAHVAREVLYHAAARAARAKTVGFNQWMVTKTMRVAAIPDAGTLTQPNTVGPDTLLRNALATLGPGALWDFALHSAPRAPSIDTELARIPEYLASANNARASNILDYDKWNTVTLDPITIGTGIVAGPSAAALITAQVWQNHDLLIPLGALANGQLQTAQPNDTVKLITRYSIEDHYSLYLNDQNW